ncbi:MAG: hypothetical protein JEZ12_18870 [Desulfobacterium sp.]|nr:hypothetical protein [Desulfobacterium sp.]
MSISTIQSGMASVSQMNHGGTSSLNPKVNGAVGQGTDAYTVEISQEAKTAEELMAEAAEGAGGAGGGADTSLIDVTIEKIKEQMEAIKAQLEQLANAEGEAAMAQKKTLTDQLASLSSQLMDLLSKKAELMA